MPQRPHDNHCFCTIRSLGEVLQAMRPSRESRCVNLDRARQSFDLSFKSTYAIKDYGGVACVRRSPLALVGSFSLSLCCSIFSVWMCPKEEARGDGWVLRRRLHYLKDDDTQDAGRIDLWMRCIERCAFSSGSFLFSS